VFSQFLHPTVKSCSGLPPLESTGSRGRRIAAQDVNGTPKRIWQNLQFWLIFQGIPEVLAELLK
jgi:hypothetical protein